MNIDFLKNYLRILNFKLENGSDNLFFTTFKDYKISVSIDKEKIEKSIINYGDKIIIHRQTTTNLSQAENLVVLECVCRLLKKGYNPESIEIEKSWNLGHQGKGFLDILVKNKDDKSLFMIECKNWGEDFNKEKNKMFKDGGQLLSYFRQDRKAKALCLYASKVENDKIDYISEIIDTKSLTGDNDDEIFNAWSRRFEKNGIFEEESECYQFKSTVLTRKKLKDLTKADGGRIFNKFAEILRRYNISNKPKAFDIMFNFFICKIYDENINYKNEDRMKFQYIRDESNEELMDKLKYLYSEGLKKYINIFTTYKSKETLKNRNLTDEEINEILYYNESGEFAFKKVYNKETFEDNIEIVKEVVCLLEEYKFRYQEKQQYLGDFFELLLNTGFKQESGQFFTPVPLARFICKSLPILKIINNKIENRDSDSFLPYVIDYASGSGHFITEMMDEIAKNIQEKIDIKLAGNKDLIKEYNNTKDDLSWAGKYIYAIEKDERLVTISKVSSFLHGDGEANVILGDGLSAFGSKKYIGILNQDKKETNNFDIIVANPPYSINSFRAEFVREYGKEKREAEDYFDLYRYLTSNSSEIECLFIERTKQLMKDGAVAGIVLPISILTNGGIYEKTREIILNHFNIKAIVSLGSNAFMATGTKTIILFLEKRPISQFNETKKVVGEFLTHFKDVTCGGFANAFSIYARSVYEMDFEDYISILQDKPTEKAKTSEMMKEYKTLSHKEIIELEREKLIYFATVYSQKIVLADSGEKDIEKEFYGYEFSNRRGHEGIHIYKDEEGKINSKLYNEDFAELEDKNKLNSYILRNFNHDKHLENEITEIQISENHPLKNHIHYVRLSQLMSFDLKKFDKSINLNKRNQFKIDSKYESKNLFEIATVDWGNTSLTKEIYKENGQYKAFSATGQDGMSDIYEHDCSGIVLSAIGARCGKCFKAEDKWLAIKNTIIIKDFKNCLRDYIFEIVNNELFWKKSGAGQPFIGVQDARNHKLPLPPLEIQQKIVAEIGEIEKKEEKATEKIEKTQVKVNNLFNKGEKTKIGDVLSLEYGVALRKNKRMKGEYPVVGSNGIDGYHNSYLIEAPSIIVGRKGSAGKVNWIDKNNTPIDTTFYVQINSDKIDLKYAFYLLKHANLESLAGGIGTPGLNRNEAYNVSINLPPLAEQQKIISQIEPLEKEIEEVKAFLASVKELKSEVLRRYL
jgi:type I restriction enzyme M protein